MATNPKNIGDNIVAERRLRPIYDWLDCGNNKKALQEADKLLKKQPKFQCARVLKGLALLRLGKEKECHELISAVHAEVPYNDATLQAMTICYRELHKPESICDLYAAAAKKDPANEELLTHLFMSYVRVGDYKKQQRTAMMLYKLAPKNPYYFWAVMSIVMQAHTSNQELKCSVVLPLAERMVDKIIQEDKIEAEQEVQLYLMILEMQGKLEEALKVVEGPLGEKLQSCVVIPVKRVQLLMKLERWAEANVMLKQSLKEDIDCWSYYKDYLDSAFHLIDSKDYDKDCKYIKDADRTIGDIARFFSDLQEDNQRLNHRLRGPYLAHLELFARLTKRGECTDILLGDLVELFMLYFHEFGGKQCCLNDLKPYLELMTEPQVKDFLDQVFKLVQLQQDQMPVTLQQMLRLISNLQLSRFLGFHESLDYESKLQLATCLMIYYDHGLKFNENMLPTDLGYNDPYSLLCAHILYDLWLDTDNVMFVRDAIVVLEYALLNRVSNYQVKLLLLKFFNLIGACKAGQRVYELLDIKHMQLDTLGYFQLAPLLNTAQYTMLVNTFNATLKFFSASCRESSDHLTISYKYGSFLKISEFVEFRDRLNNSLHYAFVQVEKPLMEIFHSTSHQHAMQMVEQAVVTPYFKMDWNKLEDNRDFSTVWSANPSKRRITPELIQQSYRTEVDLLRLRMLILQIVMCSINLNGGDSHAEHESLSNGLRNEGVNDDRDLKSLVDELLKLYDKLVETPHPKFPKNIIEGPPESRLHGYVESLYVPIVYNVYIMINGVFSKHNSSDVSSDDKRLFNGCANISVTNEQDNDETIDWRKCDISDYSTASKNVSRMLLRITTGLSDRIKEVTKSDSFNGRSETIKEITYALETLCFVSVACGVVHGFVKCAKAPPVKKGKKKKRVSAQTPDKLSGVSKLQSDSVEMLITSAIKSVEQLDAAVNHLETEWVIDSTVSEISLLLNLKEIIKSPINEWINDSYTNSLHEVSSVLRRKHRYLNELKLES